MSLITFEAFCKIAKLEITAIYDWCTAAIAPMTLFDDGFIDLLDLQTDVFAFIVGAYFGLARSCGYSTSNPIMFKEIAVETNAMIDLIALKIIIKLEIFSLFFLAIPTNLGAWERREWLDNVDALARKAIGLNLFQFHAYRDKNLNHGLLCMPRK